MKATKTTLKKIENLLGNMNYEVIYGQGNFQSGYCIVDSQNKIVVNKFYDTDARINALISVLKELPWEEHVDSSELRTFIIQKSSV